MGLIMRLWSAVVIRVPLLSLLLLLLSIVWILLFPMVSITTGELKPRGLYVDENSILVHSELFRHHLSRYRRQRDQSFSHSCNSSALNRYNICDAIIAEYGLPCLRHDFRRGQKNHHSMHEGDEDNRRPYFSNSVYQVHLSPRMAKSAAVVESTVLAFSYSIDNNDDVLGICNATTIPMMMSIFDAIYHGLREATWQSRLVIILFVPISSMTSSSTAAAHQSMFSLSEWLHLYHRPTLSQLHDYSDSSHHRFKIGIIREAYVLDLTTLPTSSSSQLSNDIRWEKASLQYSGINGLLPNMDLISYPLVLYPHQLSAESALCEVCTSWDLYRSRWKRYWHSRYSDHAALRWIHRLIDEAIEFMEGYVLNGRYKARLCGLLCSMHLLIRGPSGLGGHAMFAAFNIDSISIQPLFLSSPTAEEKENTLNNDDNSDGTHKNTPMQQQQNPQWGSVDRSRSVRGMDHLSLSEMLFGLLYISNNLQEELHHSHFYYLLMGSRDFTVRGIACNNTYAILYYNVI